MFETVSVDEALKAGQKRVNTPVLFIMLGFWALTVWLMVYFNLPAWLYAVIIPGGMIAGWVYWSFAITKWRVWAFDNVRNVHELQRRAVADKLIWPDGHFFNRTELWTPGDKAKWTQLQQKFDLDDTYSDDLTVPSEIVIAYSTKKIYTEIVVGVGLFLGCGYMFWFVDHNYKLLAGIVAGPLLIIINVIRLFRKNVRLIINDEGLSTANNPFCNWSDVYEESITSSKTNSGTLTYFYYDEGLQKRIKVNVNLENLNFTPKQITHFLRVYRLRYEQKEKRVESD